MGDAIVLLRLVCQYCREPGCLSLISGFRRDVDVICGLLGDYTAS
jgi:hypothetical protein